MSAADRRRAFARSPLLLILALMWVPLTLLVGLPIRWLFERDEPFDRLLLDAALNVVSIGPALLLSRRAEEERLDRQDPDAGALRRALRHGRVPADDPLRAELPGYLGRQRRGTRLALAVILPVCAGLVLLGLLTTGTLVWAGVYTVVALVCAGVAALTLARVRRLERRMSTPGQGG